MKLRKGTRLTDAEKEALKNFGLVNDDGTIKDEAYEVERQMSNVTSGEIAEPVKLEESNPALVEDIKKELSLNLPDYVPDTNTQKVEINTAAEEAKTDPTVTDTSGKLEIKNCPQCGWDLEVNPEEDVTDEDKRNFLRHILGGPRFYKTYPLFNNMLLVEFRSRTLEEAELIYSQLNDDTEKKEVTNPLGYGLKLTQYQLTVSLYGITASGTPTFYKEITTKEEMQDAKKFILGSFGEAKYNSVMNAFRKFEKLYTYLQGQALKPDFWTTTLG